MSLETILIIKLIVYSVLSVLMFVLAGYGIAYLMRKFPDFFFEEEEEWYEVSEDGKLIPISVEIDYIEEETNNG